MTQYILFKALMEHGAQFVEIGRIELLNSTDSLEIKTMIQQLTEGLSKAIQEKRNFSYTEDSYSFHIEMKTVVAFQLELKIDNDNRF